MEFFRDGDHSAQDAIYKAFNVTVTPEDYAVVKEADIRLYEREKLNFMRQGDGQSYPRLFPKDEIYPLLPKGAKEAYLSHFRFFTDQNQGA